MRTLPSRPNHLICKCPLQNQHLEGEDFNMNLGVRAQIFHLQHFSFSTCLISQSLFTANLRRVVQTHRLCFLTSHSFLNLQFSSPTLRCFKTTSKPNDHLLIFILFKLLETCGCENHFLLFHAGDFRHFTISGFLSTSLATFPHSTIPPFQPLNVEGPRAQSEHCFPSLATLRLSHGLKYHVC